MVDTTYWLHKYKSRIVELANQGNRKQVYTKIEKIGMKTSTNTLFTKQQEIRFKMSFYSAIYNTFIKRNSIFVGTIFAGAFVFQPVFDTAITKWYETHNKGKLWKDVKLTLGGGEDEEEDDE